MSPDNFKINFAGKAVKDPGGFLRLPLESSGSDSLRYVWVKKFDDGLWFVINNAATYAQVREPKSETVRRSHAFDADYDEPEPEPEPKEEPKPEPESKPVSLDLPPEVINPEPANNNEPEEPAEWD